MQKIECEGAAMLVNQKGYIQGTNDHVLINHVEVILDENPEAVYFNGWTILCPFMIDGYCTAITSDLKDPPKGTTYSKIRPACKFTRQNQAELPPHEIKTK